MSKFAPTIAKAYAVDGPAIELGAGVLTPADDVEGAAKASPLWAKYGTRVDAESARELLAARMERRVPEKKAPRRRTAKPAAPADPVTDFLRSRQGKALQRQVVRGVFGMLRRRL